MNTTKKRIEKNKRLNNMNPTKNRIEKTKRLNNMNPTKNNIEKTKRLNNMNLCGVRVTQILVFCVVFCSSLFVLLFCLVCHCVRVRVTRSLVLYACFVDRCLSICTFILAIVLFVLLRFTASDYPLVSSKSSGASTKEPKHDS
jgi:hypothetical protein